jgi:4-hydroxy-4-methyl-2-oxoglutarate aldolase
MKLNAAQLEELRQFDAPTVSNAIQRFGLRSKTEGFMRSEIRAAIKPPRPFVGYAVTAKIRASAAATDEQKELAYRYYEHVRSAPGPTIAVIEDLDADPVGSFWGEVQASTHLALGCIGVITSGGVRDLDEVGALGFGYLARCVLVSHANVHIEAVACPVTVGGLVVRPGDLMFADQHGALVIPEACAAELAGDCRAVAKAEEPMLHNLRAHIAAGTRPTIDELRALRIEMVRRRDSR